MRVYICLLTAIIVCILVLCSYNVHYSELVKTFPAFKRIDERLNSYNNNNRNSYKSIPFDSSFYNSSSSQSVRKQVPYPALNGKCYKYNNVSSVINICNSTLNRNYDYARIVQCATLLSKNKCPECTLATEATEGLEHPSTNWVLFGDSRVRQIFEEFRARLTSPRVLIREGDGLDGSISSAEPDWTKVQRKTDQELIGLDASFRIAYFGDAILTRLEQFLKACAENDRIRPTHLIFGTGLHFMKASQSIYQSKGAAAASKQFIEQLDKLLPLLRNFSRTTPTIYQLRDPIMTDVGNDARTNENIYLYNNITISYFSESDVILWDSAIPLAQAYFDACRRTKENTAKEMWKCGDILHVGRIVVQKYIDMLLGHICNDYM